MIKAIIFDLNGVFIQSEYLSERLEEMYIIPQAKFIPVLTDVMREARKPGNPDTFKLWEPRLREIGLDLTKEEFFNFWFSGEKIVPELIDYSKELRQKGLKVFILSNNFAERTKYYRDNFPELFSNTDGAYFSWETGFVKPERQAYLNLLEKNSLKPQECLYFDDTDRNIEVAQELGINAKKFEGLENTKKEIEPLTPEYGLEIK